MALEPMAYVQKIYAGFLGMNIGIRLGRAGGARPVELNASAIPTVISAAM